MEMKNVNNLKLVLLCILIFKCVRLYWQMGAHEDFDLHQEAYSSFDS